jgi:hypothetical protein
MLGERVMQMIPKSIRSSDLWMMSADWESLLISSSESMRSWVIRRAARRAAIHPGRDLNEDGTNWWALNPAARRGVLSAVIEAKRPGGLIADPASASVLPVVTLHR